MKPEIKLQGLISYKNRIDRQRTALLGQDCPFSKENKVSIGALYDKMTEMCDQEIACVKSNKNPQMSFFDNSL